MRENLIHNITILLEYSKLIQGIKLLYTNEEHFGLISLKTMSSLQIKFVLVQFSESDHKGESD